MPNRIREQRQAAGLTLQDVADKLGTTAVTVSRWEREPQRVTLPVLANLAKAIGVSEAELIGDGVPKMVTEGSQARADYFGIPPEHFGVVVVETDTMEPTISKGDLCYLDTRVNAVDAPGMYCIQGVKRARIARAYLLPEDKVRVISDNQRYKADDSVATSKLVVIGKVIGYTRKI